ncbi:MAG: hypothetical protein K8W52_35155 [Deltaproteobacteria bacterium]|nr:hypothetical protein [Deltaproteobacteria bacterium]
MTRSLSTLIALCSFSMIAPFAACGSDGGGFPDGGGGGGPDAAVAPTCSAVVGSCTIVGDGPSVCSEFTAPTPAASVEASCTSASGGVFSSGGCDRTGVVGGCRLTGPNIGAGCVTVWYGAELSSAQAQRACAAQGGTFVEP